MNLVLMGLYPSTLGNNISSNIGFNTNYNNNYSNITNAISKQQQQQQSMLPLSSYIFNQQMAPPLIGSIGMQMPPPQQASLTSSFPLQNPQNLCYSTFHPSPHQTTVNFSHIRQLPPSLIHQIHPNSSNQLPQSASIMQSNLLLQNSQFNLISPQHSHLQQQNFPPSATHPLVYWFPTTPPISPSNPTTSTNASAPPIYQIQSTIQPPPLPHPSTQPQVPWVLILKGAPSTVKKSEVLQFFSGFDVLAEYVQINVYNEMLVADAFVTFSSRGEAERALISKNYHKIGNNAVELFLAV